MPARPDPDRVDDHGFTVLEAAKLIGVSSETVRRWSNAVPGFAARVGAGYEWRVSPLAAMTALAIRHGKRRIPTVAVARQLPDAMRAIHRFVNEARVSPELRDAMAEAWRDKLRGYLERHRPKPPPDVDELRDSAARVLAEARDVGA